MTLYEMWQNGGRLIVTFIITIIFISWWKSYTKKRDEDKFFEACKKDKSDPLTPKEQAEIEAEFEKMYPIK